MKTNTFLTLFILAIFLVSGCQSNSNEWDWEKDDYIVSDILYANNAKLKQISSKSGNQWTVFSEYEYDPLGRISKVSCPLYSDGKKIGDNFYDSYVYNASNQLEKILYYYNNLTTIENQLIYHHFYNEDGNKQKMLTEYLYNDQRDSILYFYENDRLIQTDKYDGGSIFPGPITIKYEYDTQGYLIKETSYSGIDPYEITLHSYQNKLNVKTEIFYYNMNVKAKEIRRFYDKNNNLIYLSSNDLLHSALSSSAAATYVLKYKYD